MIRPKTNNGKFFIFSILHHNIFCNLGRSGGIFWNHWNDLVELELCQNSGCVNMQQSSGKWNWAWYFVGSCFWCQDWHFEWWHLTLMGQSNLVAVCSHSVVWIWQPTGIWMRFLSAYVHFHLPPSERNCTSCVSWLMLASLLWLSILLLPNWNECLSQLMLAPPQWLLMLLLLNCLLKLQAQMPMMQRHGVKLSLLKILELLPQTIEP